MIQYSLIRIASVLENNLPINKEMKATLNANSLKINFMVV